MQKCRVGGQMAIKEKKIAESRVNQPP
jgi:hypothetical protein